jgi:hypothetical protein
VALNTITLIPAWIDDITEILLKVALNTITLIPAWIDDITEILLKVALNTINNKTALPNTTPIQYFEL